MLLDSLIQEGKQICILLYTPFVFMLHDIFLSKQLVMTKLNAASINMDPHICYSKSVKIMLLNDCLFVTIALLQQGQVNIHFQELVYKSLHLNKGLKIKLIQSYFIRWKRNFGVCKFNVFKEF